MLAPSTGIQRFAASKYGDLLFAIMASSQILLRLLSNYGHVTFQADYWLYNLYSELDKSNDKRLKIR